jgi:CarD family transcriptional regulator
VVFKVGDKAVYAAHGIGEVTGIEKRELFGRKQKFYILRLLDSGMIVMVPMDASKNLRTIIPKSEVKKVFAVLKQQTVSIPKLTWNRRHRVYMDKLNSGSVYQVAEVLRELCLLRGRKELSFSERRVLDTARSMLVRELALARRVRESRIEKELDAIFG